MINCVLSSSKSISNGEKITTKARSLIRYVIKKREAAHELAKTLVESPNDCIITPFSDYPGPMINELLSVRFSSLTVCEPNSDKRQCLANYVQKSEPHCRVLLESDDLEQLLMKTHCNESQDRCSNIMRQSAQFLKRNPDVKPGNVKFLVPLRSFKQEMNLLNHLYDHTALRIGLYADNIFPQYYVLMTSRRLSLLQALSEEKNLRLYRSLSIAFNTIFKIDNLLNFDLKDAFGLQRRQIRSSKILDSSDIHLIRMEPRRDLIDSTQPENLMEYRYFVKQLMSKPTGKILLSLEKWFRISLSDFHRGQFNISEKTRTGDLSKDYYWQLYLYVRTLPDYQASLFMQAYQSDNLRFTRDSNNR